MAVAASDTLNRLRQDGAAKASPSPDVDLDQFRSEYDEESLGMLSEMLSTLYATPERSVLREYIANGIDAHVEHGVTRPVEVTLPTRHAATLTIRDFGKGLSREDMQRIYFSYARSTKRDSNDQIGALGIGAKSAFAVTKAWTVTNIHEGKKWVIASVNSAYGAPQQSVIIGGEPIEDDGTDATKSGITVSIPISGRHLDTYPSWEEIAKSLLTWLPEGAVTVKGVAQSHWSKSAVRYGAHAHRTDGDRFNREYNTFQIIMGGIGYAVDDITKETLNKMCRDKSQELLNEMESYTHRTAAGSHSRSDVFRPIPDYNKVTADELMAREYHGHAIIRETFLRDVFSHPLFVDMGAIDFMPSRESVKGTPRTIDTIVEAVMDTIATFSDEVMAIRNIPAPDRVEKVRELSRRTGVHVNPILAAVGVPDMYTDSSNKSDKSISLYRILNNREATVLITQMGGIVTLYKSLMMSRETGITFHTTEGDGMNPVVGDLSKFYNSQDTRVPNSMTREQYKALVPTIITTTSTKSDVRHSWYEVSETYSGDLRIGESEDTFEEIVEILEGTDTPVYVMDNCGSWTAKSAVDVGLKCVIVERGRRQIDTFNKLLGRNVKSNNDFQIDIDDLKLSNAVSVISAMSDQEVRDMAMFSGADARYMARMKNILWSKHSHMISDSHRAPKLITSYDNGKTLLADRASETTTAFNEIYKAANSSDDERAKKVPQTIRELIDSVALKPWPLLSSVDLDDDHSVKHAVIYMAAVG